MRFREITALAQPSSRLDEASKWWYDAPGEQVVAVSDHHWTDVEAWPQRFATFSDDEISDIESNAHSDAWLSERVFAARWVRVVRDVNTWYFQGRRMSDIRKAVRDILPLDDDNLTLVLEGPDAEVALSGAAIARFVKTGRLPPAQARR